MGITVKIDEQKVQKQGHVFLKDCVRSALKLKPGDSVEFHIVDNEVIIRKKKEEK